MENAIPMYQPDPTSNTDSLPFHFPMELAEYRKDGIIKKFRDEWSVSEHAACDIFEETKKFLFLADYAQKHCVTFEIDEAVLIIDKMWHTFILFTKEYAEFCDTFSAECYIIFLSVEHISWRRLETCPLAVSAYLSTSEGGFSSKSTSSTRPSASKP
ncbi:hypothetical protein [Burkholderia sp. KBS0801]|uniref:hypothetical protein n=1 Tax=Burkholderia sp. KBS0801 TaxID=1179675 RepID=UPI001C97C1E6|nr:hypothetical protein [Burkholderia sp. KBS0801]